MDWQSIARTLPDGGKTRMPHCGDDKSMIVSRSGSRLHAYCFRCGLNESEQAGQLTLAELAARRAAEARYTSGSAALPADFTTDIPKEGRVWLYCAAVYGELLSRYGIGWSPRMQRVILPIRAANGELVGTQARAVMPGQKPKYLTRMPEPHVFYASAVPGDTVVIVEDILSAIRIGEHVPAIALLGTCTPLAVALRCIEEHQHAQVACWFDADPAGDKAWAKYSAGLTLAGYTPRRIRTDRDPKRHSRREIRDIIGRNCD